MYGTGDVRVEEVADPKLEQPTDALVWIVRACVCGSDLHPYHQMPASAQGVPMATSSSESWKASARRSRASRRGIW